MPVASRMSRLELFIGVWNTKGEVLQTESGPAGALVATDTYRWLPGKHFIVHDVDARFDGQPTRSMEVMGYDQKGSKYFSRSFDDQGATEAFHLVLSGKRWRIEGDTVRFDGSFSADHDRLRGLWKLKTKRGVWQPWIDIELVRA